MVRMRLNVGALRFPTLIMAFDIVFPGKFPCITLVSNMQTLKLTFHFDFISISFQAAVNQYLNGH